MQLRGGAGAAPAAARHASTDTSAADPVVDSFEPLCDQAEALCRRLDPTLGWVDALCARLGRLTERVRDRLVA